MLLLQYSRQMTYLHCKISNSLVSKHCDCEKILQADDPADTHDDPLTTSAKVHAPDELFFLAHLSSGFKPSSLFVKKPTAYNEFFVPDSFSGKLFQPPRI
jgi:hypothetical protein